MGGSLESGRGDGVDIYAGTETVKRRDTFVIVPAEVVGAVDSLGEETARAVGVVGMTPPLEDLYDFNVGTLEEFLTAAGDLLDEKMRIGDWEGMIAQDVGRLLEDVFEGAVIIDDNRNLGELVDVVLVEKGFDKWGKF
jgi:hypothetical protein